jgi:hypothetical protein
MPLPQLNLNLGSGPTLGFLAGMLFILISIIWLFIEADKDRKYVEANQSKRNKRVTIAASFGIVGIIIVLVLGLIMLM